MGAVQLISPEIQRERRQPAASMLNVFVTQNQYGKQQLNASFTTGDVVAMAFTGTNSDATPLNLSGAIIKMTIGFDTPLELTTFNGGIIVTDAANGKFTVNMSSNMTALFIPGAYPYDLWIQPQLSPPVETQYITGDIYVNQSVTVVP